MNQPFPFSPGARLGGVLALISSVTLVAWSVVPAIVGGRPPDGAPLMAAVACNGAALLVVVGCSIAPCRRHKEATGGYLVPGRGGAIETRHAAVAWGVLGCYGMVAVAMVAVGLWGMVVL